MSGFRTSPRRRAVNGIMTGLTWLAAVLATLPLLFILFYLLQKGATSLNLGFFTQPPAPPGRRGRRDGQRDRGDDRGGGGRERVRRADRHRGGHLPRREEGRAPGHDRALPGRRAQRAPVDRHGDLRVGAGGGADGPLLRAGGRPRPRGDDDPDGDAHHRGDGARGARPASARRRSRSGTRAGAPRSASSSPPRSRGSSRASWSRWRASPARPRRCSSPRSATASGRSPSTSRSRRSPCRSSCTPPVPTTTGMRRRGQARSCSSRSC